MSIQINQHEIVKIKKFIESELDEDSAKMIQDTTDILKNMIVSVNDHKVKKTWDYLAKIVEHNLHYILSALFVSIFSI